MQLQQRYQRILELVAKLATLDPKESRRSDEVVAEYAALIGSDSPADADVGEMGGVDLLSGLATFHLEVRRIVQGLLSGTEQSLLGEYLLRPIPGPTVSEVGGRLRPGWQRTSGIPLLGEFLHYVWGAAVRRQRCPFGRCPVCGVVFVQPQRGKPRRYCSQRCKAKGVPSASKRTQYVREYRRQKREQEIQTARRVLRAWPKHEQFAQLEKQFPTKPRRELLYLIKKARVAQSEPTSRKERRED